MKTIGFSAISAVLVIVAASSLISMIGLFQIDRIVNQDLYQYGLEFSYAWAMPYWTITKLIFATGWFNIIAAIAFHLYILAYGQKGTQQIEPQTEKEILETTKPINEEKTETETKPTEQTPQPQPEQAEQPKETQKVEEPKQPIATETPPPETETKPSETQQKSEEEPTKTQLPQEQEPPPTSVL